MKHTPGPKPLWLKRTIPFDERAGEVRAALSRNHVHTICESGRCANRGLCFSRGTATFLLLGDRCTRSCLFCSVDHRAPFALDPEEPRAVARTARDLGLAYVVLTSVTRDDLPDGGARQFRRTVDSIHHLSPRTAIEVLTPDFGGSRAAVLDLAGCKLACFAHNLETVSRLYVRVRPRADYRRSLDLLALVKEIQPGLPTKSSLILGLGEESVEVKDALRDLRAAGCDIVTLGQYLPPSRDHPPATDYIHPDLFNHYRDWGLALGFSRVLAGPFVRSSLLADECSQSPISSEEGSAMKTTVTARHFELTEPLRVHADETFQRLRRFFNHIAEVHVILETEKYRHRAEATLRLENGTTFVAAEQSNDMYLSLDRSAEKLETQLRRYKEKFRTRKLHGNNKEASLGERD